MKRSSFLKTLLGIAIAPKAIAEVKEKNPVAVYPYRPQSKRELYHPDLKDSDFGTVHRSMIADMIYPKVKQWSVATFDRQTGGHYTESHAMTYVDKKIGETHFAVLVRNHYSSRGKESLQSDEAQCYSSLVKDAAMLTAMEYYPIQSLDTIIIG